MGYDVSNSYQSLVFSKENPLFEVDDQAKEWSSSALGFAAEWAKSQNQQSVYPNPSELDPRHLPHRLYRFKHPLTRGNSCRCPPQ
jgi:hypothetical protein